MLNLHKNHLPLFIVLLSFVVAAAHATALNFYLYWTFWWFDLSVHFLGGLWVALTSLWIYIFIRGDKELSRRRTFFIVLISIIVVGGLWEAFEYFAGISPGNNFIIDTTTDGLMDLLGAGAGILYFNRTHNRSTIV